MHRGFTKLFNTIVTSTIWQEDDKTRIVWITMLAIADAHGLVNASVPGLASVANVSVYAARNAIKTLLSPDADSRTKDFEGRRIEELDGGWRILNYAKYRRMLNEEERREYKARWIAEKRRQPSTKSRQASTLRRRASTVSTQAEAEAEKKEDGANGSRPTSDSDWLDALCKDETYRGIDVRREHGKMTAWCKTNRKEPTRRRFINWLNRVDRPMTLAKPTAPVYGRNRLPPQNELSEAELAAQRKIVREASEKLRSELNR
jgi:hypothetical protein